MHLGSFWQSLRLGALRRWKSGVSTSLTVLGAVWLLTEITTRVSEEADVWLDEHRTLYVAAALGAAVLGFLIATYEARCISFNIPTTDTKLTLKFGDLFAQDADWLVGVNDLFDSHLGDLVSPSSLHGKVIRDHFGGNEGKFREQVDAALTKQQGIQVERRIGASMRYAVGTTAVLDRADKHIYLVAIAQTDLATNKARSTIPELWCAIQEALRSVHEYGNGQPLALPLVGNGRASINLPPQHLLRLITLAIVDFARRSDLPKSVTLVLAEDCFSALDLREIRRDWRTI